MGRRRFAASVSWALQQPLGAQALGCRTVALGRGDHPSSAVGLEAWITDNQAGHVT